MKATSLSARPGLPVRNLSMNRIRINTLTVKRFFVCAKQGTTDGESGAENKIVVRMSIRKMKATESNSNQEPSPLTNLKDLEKKSFTQFQLEDFSEAIELLQSYLMKPRPSVAALGVVVVLVAMSVPVTSVAMVNALKVVKELLAGSHVCINIDF